VWLEAGQLRLAPVEVAAAELLAEAASLLGPSAASQGVELVAEGDGAARVRCDRQRVLQVLGNLVGNALRYAPPGSRVWLRAAPVGDAVELSVTDQGPGIPPEELPRIFDRFYRSGAKGKTGLGLFIARAIVEAHGGALAVDAPPGGGCTFRLTLPAA
jgi:signal transduction histidine kinase